MLIISRGAANYFGTLTIFVTKKGFAKKVTICKKVIKTLDYRARRVV